MVNSLVGAFRGNASFRPRAEPRDKQRTEGDDAKWYCELDESGDGSSPNGRFLRHRFSSKPTSVATVNSLPKRNHVAKEAVSAAWQIKRDTEAINVANQMMLHRRSRGIA